MFQVAPTPRLVPSPIFILSAPHSGSSLLRSILGTHSQVHATLELVVTELGVEFLDFPARVGMRTAYTELVFANAGLNTRELEYLLWDRVLHHELVRSGKSVLVVKAPRLLLRWPRLAECWPRAQFVFLLRHPMNILLSGLEVTRGINSANELTDVYLRLLHLLQEARDTLPGPTLRYEELTADPAGTCRKLCESLDLDWEPQMVEYGRADHGPLGFGGGDSGAKMASGTVQPGRPLPADETIPSPFRAITRKLGYGRSPAAPAAE